MKKLYFLIILSLVFNVIKLEASIFANPLSFKLKPHSKATPIPKCLAAKVDLPIKQVQNLLIIQATIEGQTGNFILDTGAPYLVLNKTYFRNAIQNRSMVSAGITGVGAEIESIIVKSFMLGEIQYKDIDADVVNLSAIENSKGIKILGLLGTNLFTSFEISIDARLGMFSIYKLDKAGTPLFRDSIKVDSATFTLPIIVKNDIVFLETKINGKVIMMCFDSAAEVNMLNTGVSKKVIEYFVVSKRASLVGSTGAKSQVISGVIKETVIGGVKFNVMPTYLASLTNLQMVYDNYFDGMLGFPFLFKGSVKINFVKNELKMYQYVN